jgi:3-hexulose-6-phosphate synthase/6-phospho-3-hexuloisomerase
MIAIGAIALLAVSQAPAASRSPDFTSSDLADAAERLTGRRSHMSGAIHLLAGKGLAGPAITMRLVRDDSASLTEEGLAAIRFIEAAPEGSVVVVAMEGDKSFAIFGTTFATLAQRRRLAGFVVEGAVRGLPALRRMAFPTFAGGTVAGSAGGHYRIEAVNVTVTCGEVQVSPGDFIVGDEDGVAVAPRERLSEILAKAAALRQEKEDLLPLIARFGSYTKAMEEYRRRAARRP